MAVSPNDALKRSIAALSRFEPASEFVLEPVQAGAVPKETIVFRAKRKGAPKALICKTGETEEWVCKKLECQAEAQAKIHQALGSGIHRVPKVLLFDKENVCLVQEDAKGRSLTQILRDEDREGIDAALARVGAWLRNFHNLSAAQEPFDPDPHMSWIEGLQFLPALSEANHKFLLDRLYRLAEEAEGKTVTVAACHGDCHSGQFHLRGNGTVYGLDFEKLDRSEVFRDLYHLTLHITHRVLQPGAATHADLRKALSVGYGAEESAPQVGAFWNLFARANQLGLYLAHKGKDAAKDRVAAMSDGLKAAMHGDTD